MECALPLCAALGVKRACRARAAHACLASCPPLRSSTRSVPSCVSVRLVHCGARTKECALVCGVPALRPPPPCAAQQPAAAPRVQPLAQRLARPAGGGRGRARQEAAPAAARCALHSTSSWHALWLSLCALAQLASGRVRQAEARWLQVREHAACCAVLPVRRCALRVRQGRHHVPGGHQHRPLTGSRWPPAPSPRR